DHQLCVGVERGPRPAVAPAVRLLLVRRVLFLRADEGPDFITLHAARADATNLLVLILRRRLAERDQQLRDGVLRCTRQADRCTDAATFTERTDDRGALLGAQLIHNDHYAYS